MKTTHLIPRLIAITLLSIAAAAPGATLTVNSTADAGGTCPGATCTLRQAILTAAAGDTINFAPGITTITLTSGQLLINKNLTINGPGANLLRVERSTASGTPAFRIFSIASASATISGLTIASGSPPTGDPHGGAFYSDGGSKLTILNSTISNNFANNGGGIYNLGELAIANSTLWGNSASTDGGGIYNDQIGATITNSTISSNFADSGAGIYNSGGGKLTIINSTIAINTGGFAEEGGGIFNAGGAAEVKVRNTIISGNYASFGPDFHGTLTSQGYNLIGNTSGTTITGTTTGNQLNVDPKLNPLQDSGGPTLTMTPHLGSPAIDKGGSGGGATDQRGFSRPVDNLNVGNAIDGDASDIGAVEVGLLQPGPAFTVTNTAEHDDDSCTTDDCTLLEALKNVANAPGEANTITFAPGVTGTIENSLSYGLPILRPVTIVGPGARNLTLSGKNANRIFYIPTIAGNINVNISGLTLYNGRAAGSSFPDNCGGAILNSASLTLTDCAFVGNSASLHGGAIYNDGQNAGNAKLTLVNCTLSQNGASASGGGIFSNAYYSGTTALNLTNCTLSANTASQYGGAIYNDGAGNGNAALTLTNCTLNQNAASSYGGGIVNDGLDPGNPGTAVVTLRNTILRAGSSGANLVNDGGTFTSQGSNLSSDDAGGDGGGTGPGGFLNAAGDKRNTDPQLDTLKNNGGPTDTVALLAGPPAPARDAGNDSLAPSTDQRGYPRVGVSDMGAFEFGSSLPTPTPTPGPTPPPIPQCRDSIDNDGDALIDLADPGCSSPEDNSESPDPTPTPIGTPTPTPAPVPTRLANISTRLRVETGDNALIGGLIVTGTQQKKVIVRGIGTSLSLLGKLENPTLELHGPNGLVEANDNWVDSPNKQAIIDSTIPPSSDLESAIVATLPANNAGYTAILRGVNNSTGIGVVEAYDLDSSVDSKLANISTRGFVQTGDNVLIAGTIIVGQTAQKVLIRAIGPSLALSGRLEDPTLELRDANGILLEGNDNWVDSPNKQAIIDTTIPPTHDLESAIVATLPSNNASYTAIVRGLNNSTGIAVVEVYGLN